MLSMFMDPASIFKTRKKSWSHSEVLGCVGKREGEGGHSSFTIVWQCVESHCNKYELGEVGGEPVGLGDEYWARFCNYFSFSVTCLGIFLDPLKITTNI